MDSSQRVFLFSIIFAIAASGVGGVLMGAAIFIAWCNGAIFVICYYNENLDAAQAHFTEKRKRTTE